ncbi:MAG: SGNH/GDSL hydrolase family protein, partial [Pirellulales bacterium]
MLFPRTCVMLRRVCLAVCFAAATPAWSAEPIERDREGPFELLDGDRVALIGNTLFEREQSFGDWEHELTRRYPDRHITFRNLGWSGDRPSGISRKRFGNVEEGFQHLRKSIELVRPTVVLINYGANAAHEGEAGHAPFFAELDQLFALLEPIGARLVLVSPMEHEHMGEPLPNPAAYNAQVRALRDAMKEYAQAKNCDFADLVEHFQRASTQANDSVEPTDAWTDNGIHFSPYGYWRSAPVFARSLGLQPLPKWSMELDAKGQLIHAAGVAVDNVSAKTEPARFELSFKAADKAMPRATVPPHAPEGAQQFADARTMQLRGLSPGNYRLTVDGQPVATAPAEEWARGVTWTTGPSFAQANELREVIRRKNELFFHRYRPQNETYL